jgi:hypothetical protein
MSDVSQIVVPPSFIGLYLEPGRARPASPRAEILERYEFCEDLATLLIDSARSRLWELGLPEAEVLDRIRQGLLAGDAGLGAAEAGWVVTRLAELLGWPLPG